MHAFTRPSLQLRLKVRDALLRSLHHSSLYRRLVVANREKGDRTNTVGHAIHTKLTRSPWEGTALLKFLYGQLYNGRKKGKIPYKRACEGHRVHGGYTLLSLNPIPGGKQTK